MMRKKQKRISVIALAALFGISGCSREDTPKGCEDYTVKKEQYVDEYTEQYDYWYMVTVEYPVLSGIDEEQEEIINKALYDMAMEKVNYWHLTPNEEVKALQEEYSIYSNDVRCDVDFHSQYLLSVAFHETYAPVSPFNYAQMTQRCANINLLTGEQYQPFDIFQMDDNFMELWCKQVEADGNYDDLIFNDADTRETFRAWFLGEYKEAEEDYIFTPFFCIDGNKDFVIGLSCDPKPGKLSGDLPKDNCFYAHFQTSDLEPYRTDSEFWELYDESQSTGTVIENETLKENIWLGENANVWDFWEERQEKYYDDVLSQISNLSPEKKNAKERILGR